MIKKMLPIYRKDFGKTIEPCSMISFKGVGPVTVILASGQQVTLAGAHRKMNFLPLSITRIIKGGRRIDEVFVYYYYE